MTIGSGGQFEVGEKYRGEFGELKKRGTRYDKEGATENFD